MMVLGYDHEERSESGQNVSYRDSHLQVGVLAQRRDVLLYGIADGRLVESVCYVPLHLHANLSDVGHRLTGSHVDSFQYGLQVALAKG